MKGGSRRSCLLLAAVLLSLLVCPARSAAPKASKAGALIGTVEESGQGAYLRVAIPLVTDDAAPQSML